MKTILTMNNRIRFGTFSWLTVLSLLFLAFSSQMLEAQTTWNGSTDTDWATASNWDTGTVPTALDDVIIPNTTNHPVIGSSTAALAISVVINNGAALDISAGGSISIDGTSTLVSSIAFENSGTLTNDGTMNFGLNSLIGLSSAFKNGASGTFINNGSLFTDQVGVIGGQTLFNQGDFQNNGLIELGPGSVYFGIFNAGTNSNFDNFGQIDLNLPIVANLFVSENSTFDNFGEINIVGIRGLRQSTGSTFHNHPCAEYRSAANVSNTGYINNEGLWFQTVGVGNGGTWDNTGTMNLNQTGYIGTPINNSDIVIFRSNLTNNCGELNPSFDLGNSVGSTLSIFTDATATTSAGTYDLGTNTFTPNFALTNTTYNLFVKVEDDANVCNDYILPWSLTVTTAPCCNLTTWTGNDSGDWDDANNWDTYLVPTACNDVVIPALANQPTIGGSTTAEAASVTVDLDATLAIAGVLNLETDGIDNFGSITNSGSINVGISTTTPVPNAISNYATGSFTNDGTITTGLVATAGGINIQTFGPFINNGSIVVSPGWGAGSFGIGVYNNGLLTNNGSIENNSGTGGAFLLMQGTPAEILNNGVINLNTAGVRLSFGGTLTNAPCGEILEAGFNICADCLVDNSGLIRSVPGTSLNNGTWDNLGTIYSASTSNLSSPNAIGNQDLIIQPVTLTNNCGELSPAFDIGANLGSTVSIYTDAFATVSAGTYDLGTNTFTPNFALTNTTYNLFVKVEDDANVCNDYILPWSLTVTTAPCCNLTTWTGNDSGDWDDANNWDTYLVPTACNDVDIPALANQPTIGGSTTAEAASVTVDPDATLAIAGVLNLETDGIDNFGSITNSGSINVGLSTTTPVPNAISNYATGSFTNDGTITTGLVATAGGINIQTFGPFINNGSIVVSPGWGAGSFGIGVYNDGLLTNNGTIENNSGTGGAFLLMQGTPAEILNNGVIDLNTAGVRLSFGGTLTNAPCGEILEAGFNICADCLVDNSGLIRSVPGTSLNNGTWDNLGTIYSASASAISSPNAIDNQDLIIQPVTLTNVCGELSPAFGIGPNLGSTVSIYTDAAATVSAGTYSPGTNTFTPNFALGNTTYNLFVKVAADTDPCDDYTLAWDLTVIDCVDTDGDDICDSCDPDDDDDGVLDVDDSDPLDNTVCQDSDGDGCDDCSSGSVDASNDGTDTDGDGICDSGDPDDDNDGVLDVDDSDPLDNTVCQDSDGDGCDDCSSGTFNPATDGTDTDSDGICDSGDDDDDNDGVLDGDDSDPLDNTVCQDSDGDGCDDCSSGTFNPANDGTDTDSDGICDSGDPDDDNDGVLDGDDSNPLDNTVCQDLDDDGCDDCSSGSVDASNDGTDTDSDGLCDSGDPDDDNDGVLDGDDSDPLDNTVCQDSDGDGCDDCSSGSVDASNDGTDTDGDGICDSGDPDDDNDGVLDGDDSDPLNNFVCQDSDGDGCDDCSSGSVDASNDGTDTDGDGICDNSDNCISVYNPDQTDLDGNGVGDICDVGSVCGYTVMAGEEVKMKETTVWSGGVGVVEDDKEAKIEDGTFILTDNTFVNAVEVDVDDDAQVDNIISPFVSISLPSGVSYIDLDGENVTVDDDEVVTLDMNSYDKVKIKKNATVTFSGHSTVYIKDLKVEDGSTLLFDQCTNIVTDKSIDLHKNVSVNVSGMYIVSLYSEKDIKVKEGSTIHANLYAEKIKVDGKSNNPTEMKGLFIAEKKFESKKNVNLYGADNCGSPCLPSEALVSQIDNESMEDLPATYNHHNHELINTGTKRSSNEFSLYPNPANTTLNISLDNFMGENIQLLIQSSLGKVIYSENMKVNTKTKQVLLYNINLNSGIYMVSIIENGKIHGKKLSIIR